MHLSYGDSELDVLKESNSVCQVGMAWLGTQHYNSMPRSPQRAAHMPTVTFSFYQGVLPRPHQKLKA